MSDLPDGWASAQLGDLLERIVGGGTPSKSNQAYFQGAIPFMTVKDLHARFVADTQDHISEAALEDCASTLIPADTFVVATRMSLGKITRPLVPTAINQDLKALFLQDGIDKTYVEYLWRANEARIQGMGTGTTVKGIRLEDIRGLDVPLAPSAEQTRITNQLDTLLARVNACNDRIGAIPGILKRFRQAVLSNALAGALTGVHPTKAACKAVCISEIADVGTGSTPLRSNSSFFANSGMPWVTSAATGAPLINSAEQFVTEAAITAHRLKTYPHGTLLVAMYGEGKTRGQVSELGIAATINQACAAITVNESKASRQYVKLALTANYLTMRELAEGGNQPNLNLSKIKEFEIPLPPLDEQVEIVRRVEALFAMAVRIEARLSAMRDHAQRLTPRLLAKAFRGELVQQDPQDEPASVLLQRIAAVQPAKAKVPRGRPRAQTKEMPLLQPLAPVGGSALPDGAWSAPVDTNGFDVVVLLTAVLKAWGTPMPQVQARLATLLCQQPRLLTAVLPADKAAQWCRLVGDAAQLLPAQVTRFQPATNSHWRRALVSMRARGDVLESGTGAQSTWALGPAAAQVETAGWPDGRAGWVVAYLQAHGVDVVLPKLEPMAREFVDVKAA